jgi:hypothetical protein
MAIRPAATLAVYARPGSFDPRIAAVAELTAAAFVGWSLFCAARAMAGQVRALLRLSAAGFTIAAVGTGAELCVRSHHVPGWLWWAWILVGFALVAGGLALSTAGEQITGGRRFANTAAVPLAVMTFGIPMSLVMRTATQSLLVLQPFALSGVTAALWIGVHLALAKVVVHAARHASPAALATAVALDRPDALSR